MGFDAEWCVLGACDAGAPHRRERIWVLAAHPKRIGSHHPKDIRELEGQRSCELRPVEPRDPGDVAHAESISGGSRLRQGWQVGLGDQPSNRSGDDSDTLRPRLPQPKPKALLRARGGAERGTTRELRESLPYPTGDRHGQGREIGNLRQEDGGQNGGLLPEPPEPGWWATEPAMGRTPYGMADGMDKS
jgi:site-specific DNA-cytosine methylase